ncbi:MAG TPA: glycine zipper 2TM domain-containing protein [Sedimentisphaerales bacterium]|nr:glycine zipper 2TM domain-containing protein [Sedimentisphaerales bacterium]
MKAVWVGVFLAAMAVGGCASSEAESTAVAGYDFSGLNKIAIVEVTGRVYGEAAKNKVSNLVTMALMKKGYTFIERQNVKALLKEQEFQASDLTTDAGAARAGQILNVPAVMVIDIPKFRDGKIDMSAKLVDVENGTILWMGSGSGSTNKTLGTIAGAAAGAALGAAVAGGDSSDRWLGAGVGAVAGGVAGNMLTPSEEKQVSKVVSKVVKDFPSRLPPAAKSK